MSTWKSSFVPRISTEWGVLSLILLLAAFLRLFRINVLMRFIWDEGRDMLAIHNIIVNRDLTLFGPFNEIAGHIDFFGVFQYYFMLPALWIANFNPVGPAIFTALLGVATVGIWYIWLRQHFPTKTALAIAALYASSPLVVRFTQWPWNPNTIGFFAGLYFLALHFWQKNPPKKRLFRWGWALLAGILLGLLFQLHYFTIVLGLTALLLWINFRPRDWGSVVLFFFGWLLPNLSFVLFDITHEGFYRHIIWESFAGGNNQQFFLVSFGSLVTGPLQYLWDVSGKFAGHWLLGILVLGALLWQAFLRTQKCFTSPTAKNCTHPVLQLLAPWLGFLIFPMVFPTLIDDYHSGALWISLATVLVLTLQKVVPKYWLWIIGLLTASFIAANQLWRAPTWQENMPRLRTAAQAIATDMQNSHNSAVNIASFVDPETRGIRFRYFVAVENQPLLGFDDYPRSQTLYVITPHTWEETRQNPAWELDTFRAIETATPVWNDNNWAVFRIEK